MFRNFIITVIISITTLYIYPQQSKIDSLQALLKTTKEDTNKVKVLNSLCIELAGNNSNSKEAFPYAEYALILAERLEYKKGIANSCSNIGMMYYYKGDYDKALAFDLKSLNIHIELGDKLRIALLYDKIGVLYYDKGDYKKALPYLLKSLKIYKEIKNKQGIGNLYNNIGLLYYYIKDYNKSLTYYLKSLKIMKEITDKPGLANSYNNIGMIYYDKKDYNKALIYFLKSLEIRKRIGNKQSIADSYNNVGEIYKNKGLYNKSINYFDKGLEISTKIGYKSLITVIYYNMSDLYSKKGNYRKAYEYYKLSSVYHDSIFNAESDERFREQEINYETEKKQRQIYKLQQEKKVNEIKTRQTNIILISSLIVIILASILLFNKARMRHKINVEKVLAQEQKTRFKAVMDMQESERRRIAHDLHDSLGQLLSTIKINFAALERTVNSASEQEKTVYNNSISLIDEACSETRSISHSIMPGTLMRLGFTPAVKELIDKVSSAGKIKVSVDLQGFEERVNEFVEVSLYRIIQEITNNIIKHSGASVFDIKIIKDKNNISISMKDNGKGMDTSAIEKSEGIGWKGIFSRVHLINGDIKIKSDIGAGTVIDINIAI